MLTIDPAEDHGAAIIEEVVVGRSKTPSARRRLERFIETPEERGTRIVGGEVAAVSGTSTTVAWWTSPSRRESPRGSVDRWLQCCLGRVVYVPSYAGGV